MRIDEFFDALGEIDEDMVTKAKSRVDDPIKVKVERGSWKPFAAVAACLAVAVIGIAVFIGVNSRRDDIVKPDKSGSSDPVVSSSGLVRAEFPEKAKYQYTGDFSELELFEYALVDRIAYYKFDSLVENSDLIVVGTFVDDARQTVPLNNGSGIIGGSTDGASFNKLRIDSVYKGDIGVGSEIIICDGYYVSSGKLMYIGSTCSTPMIKGEQWVYFLRKVSPEYGDYYHSLYAEGRYPVPGNENVFVLTGSDRGVYEDMWFNENTYNDVKIMLGYADGVEKLDFEDWTANYEFTMPDFIGETFVKRAGDIYAAGTSRILFEAPGIIDVYLADLNGDGKREIVSKCWNGASGMAADYIIAYDHTNSKRYVLKGSIADVNWLWDYGLEVRNNVLYAVGYKDMAHKEEVSAEPLTLDMMTEFELGEDLVAYDGKTYKIVKSLYTDEGVRFMIGVTRPEYEAGGYIEVLGIVENNNGKEIGLLTPCQGKGSHTEISTAITQGDVRLYDTTVWGLSFDTALGSTIIQPGETYYQAMLFDTRAERIDDNDTLLPLLHPLGGYNGTAIIALLSDPHDTSSKTTDYTLKFDINIVNRREVKYPEEDVRSVEEFGGYVTLMYNRRMVNANDSLSGFNLFGGMPIENLYLIDLNGDGKREVCATVYYGSGIIDSRIMAYDLQNKKLYELSNRGYYDYRLRMEEQIDGSFRAVAEKWKYNSSIRLSSEWLSLDDMTEVVQQTADVREPVSGAWEVVGFDRYFEMDEFSDDTFYVNENTIKVTDKNGETTELYGDTIKKVYLYDLTGDGKREIVVEGVTQPIADPGTKIPDPVKIISVIDLENNYGYNLFPYQKECSLAIVGNALHIVINGEVQPEPLTYERFEELAKSPDI